MPFDQLDDKVSDDALLVLYANGDREAALVLTRRHLPYVFKVAMRFLGNKADAEDIAQDAMMRLWKAAPDWRSGEAKLTTWLYTVTANLCRDQFRKKKGVGLDEIEEPIDDAPSVETKMTQNDRANALYQAIAQLPERQRMAITHRHLQDLNNPEIAEAMGISVEAVESLTSRGRKKLAEILLQQHDELGME